VDPSRPHLSNIRVKIMDLYFMQVQGTDTIIVVVIISLRFFGSGVVPKGRTVIETLVWVLMLHWSKIPNKANEIMPK
jgi:hypothetical protein